MAKATCSVDDCDLPARGRGWCPKHYSRWRAHGDPLGGRYGRVRRIDPSVTCYAEGGCGLPVEAKGLCSKHYARLRLTGVVDTIVRDMVAGDTVVAFFTDLIATGGEGCVTWPWKKNKQGYGKTTAMGEVLAHRVACRLAHGEPPDDKPLALHRCGKGHEGCVAPWHLYWGDKVENAMDALGHGTLCIGEMIWNAKLTADVIPAIRRSRGSDQEIALAYGVARATIGDVRAGRTWKHVPWE